MKLKYFVYAILIGLFVLPLISCAPQKGAFQQKYMSNFTAVHERAADNLVANCGLNLDKGQPIIVTSLANIDDLQKSSTLGRMSSEMIAGRLAQHGFMVREVKMSDTDIFVSEEQGEMILSRDLQQIGQEHDVQGFVVGTYAVGQKYRHYDADVFISLRYVNVDNNIVCSSNYTVRNTDPALWQ
jgi:hypothetical protein